MSQNYEKLYLTTEDPKLKSKHKDQDKTIQSLQSILYILKELTAEISTLDLEIQSIKYMLEDINKNTARSCRSYEVKNQETLRK